MAEPGRIHSTSLPVHPGFSPGTYVIQIPKDQIYRIPPPENALIVECHRNPSVSTSKRRSCCFRIFIPIFIVLLLILILALVLPPLLTPPKPPVFKLTKFRLTPSTHDFQIDLNILNPNPSGFIEFKSPSHASLSFQKRKVAVAKFPLIQQEHGSQRHVALALRTKSSSFPKELERRIKNKSKLKTSMSLMMDLPAHTKGRLSTRRDVKFVVTCSFTVNTLGKNSRILSQDCQSERQ